MKIAIACALSTLLLAGCATRTDEYCAMPTPPADEAFPRCTMDSQCGATSSEGACNARVRTAGGVVGRCTRSCDPGIGRNCPLGLQCVRGFCTPRTCAQDTDCAPTQTCVLTEEDRTCPYPGACGGTVGVCGPISCPAR